MHSITKSFTVRTSGKGTYEITDKVQKIVHESGIKNGICTVFIAHTSASLIIYECADPSACTDLHEYFDRLCPEDEDYFIHTQEGSDDMPSHLRMVLTRTSEVIPIENGRLALGTWQGIFVFEHRRITHTRRITVNITGV